MKRTFHHPPAPKGGKKYWRSLGEFAETPEFRAKLAQEFPRGAAELEGDEITRRSFMKFMGASVALAGVGLTGCRRPLLHGVPYTKGVEWQIPGEVLHYATSMPRRGGAFPLIATTTNGRPIKLDGNPNVPGFNGTSDIFAQAAILDLYDPDRATTVLKAANRIAIKPSMDADGKTQDVTLTKEQMDAGTGAGRGKAGGYVEASIDDFWEELAIVKNFYAKNSGDGLAFLAEPCSSPTRARLVAELQKQFPKMVWAEYEPWTHQAGAAPVYDFSKADVIVSLDCDFLGASDGTPQSINQFAQGRKRLGKTQETMSRLYVIEGRLSLTGSMADHRLRVPSSSIGGIATLLASKLGNGLPTGNSFAAFNDPNVDAWVTAMAADLQKAGARGLVVAGAMQPASVHAAVAALNQALGAPGPLNAGGATGGATTVAASLSDLAETISQGTIKTLIVLGGNPAFTAPTELGFDEVIGQVEQVIRVGLHVDETSAVATSHVPMKHLLEAWGDHLSWDGTYLSQQPVVEPLYPSVSEIELVAFLLDQSTKGFDLVRKTFASASAQNTFDSNFKPGETRENTWRQFVHDGYMGGTIFFPPVASPSASSAPKSGPTRPLQPDEYELTFFLGNIDDGRYANNGWLQELPDTVSKLTWDNALLVSPNTATKLGVNVMPPNHSSADLPDTDWNPRTTDNTPFEATPVDPTTAFPMVKLTTPDGRTMELPVLVVPGQHDQTLSLALGWGRTAPRLTKAQQDVVTPPLRIAEGAGFNAYALRTAATPGFVTGVKVEKIAKTYPLAMTQEHNSMEGRGLVREATLDKYHEDPAFVQEIGTDKDTPQGELTGYQNFESGYIPPELNSRTHRSDRPAWGMVIDLNTCVGCNTCTIACQAENNIPVVGKFQVIRGREMAWIRIDRYFGTDVSAGNPTDSKYLEDPQVLFQPMACQQCEERAVRAGLPGQRHNPQRRGAQRHGLQPLHRHAVLREQLPVQGAPLQFLQLQRAAHPDGEAPRPRRRGGALPRAAGRPRRPAHLQGLAAERDAAEESQRDRAHARRDGEMHLLRPAHRGGEDRAVAQVEPVRRGLRRHRAADRRLQGRLPAGLPGGRDHLRQPERSGQPGLHRQGRRAQLRRAGLSRHTSAHHLPGPRAQPEHGHAGRATHRAHQRVRRGIERPGKERRGQSRPPGKREAQHRRPRAGRGGEGSERMKHTLCSAGKGMTKFPNYQISRNGELGSGTFPPSPDPMSSFGNLENLVIWSNPGVPALEGSSH